MVAILALLCTPLWVVIPAATPAALAIGAYLFGEGVKTWVYIKSLK
jgi:hypothetical protein